MIRKKDVDGVGLIQKFESDNKSKWGGIAIRVQEIPNGIFELEEIKSLEIFFVDSIIQVVPNSIRKAFYPVESKLCYSERGSLLTSFPTAITWLLEMTFKILIKRNLCLNVGRL